LEFQFKSKAQGEKARLLAAFETFAKENHLSDALHQAADLAIEEHLTNVLSYGFSDADEHLVTLKIQSDSGDLVIEVIDDGRPFDPTKFPEPDLSVPPEKRKIGGLGIHMIREAMDSLQYTRADGRNILQMRKKLRD
jgi:anti-sigma regulatory factor (Ser/Thr protein kinase)